MEEEVPVLIFMYRFNTVFMQKLTLALKTRACIKSKFLYKIQLNK